MHLTNIHACACMIAAFEVITHSTTKMHAQLYQTHMYSYQYPAYLIYKHLHI